MEKVKLSKFHFDAMEELKEQIALYNESFYTVMERYIENDYRGAKYLEKLKHFDLLQIAEMLILGYELHETKEEKLKKYYEQKLNSKENIYEFSKALGIYDCLEILGIRIEDINK